MKRIVFITAAVTVFTLSVLFAGCENQMDGGDCLYTDYPGTATVQTVTVNNSSSRNCEDAVIITFDFVPDDSTAVDKYRFPAWPDTGRTFNLIGGGSIPSGWAEKEGLIVGSEHLCTRQEIKTGPCTPLIFEFPEIDFSDWPDYCD